jgi:hypothetical protein
LCLGREEKTTMLAVGHCFDRFCCGAAQSEWSTSGSLSSSCCFPSEVTEETVVREDGGQR